MNIHLLRLACCLAFACPAIATQSARGINISLQDPAQLLVPSPSYSAASFQAGAWNRVVDTATPTALIDLEGNSTGVSIHPNFAWYYLLQDLPTTFGDDELLFDSGFTTPDPGGRFTVFGLAPGDYSLFTYVINDRITIGSSITVQGVSIDTPWWGATYNGAFIEGTTHIIHQVSVQPGQAIEISTDVIFGEYPLKIQGFQFVPNDALHSVHYCDSQVNSTGAMASMYFVGSSSIQRNDLLLGVRDLPPNQIGYFIVSTNPGSHIIPPGSQGNLCISGAVGRLNRPGEVLFSGMGGDVLNSIDLTDVAQPNGRVAIMPGESWHWQFWYRDNNPTSTSNFSDAYRIGFTQ